MNATDETAPGSILTGESAYLQDARFSLITDSQDIAHACEYLVRELRVQGIEPQDVSGLLIDAREGDYNEAWVTTGRAPHRTSTDWVCVL